MLGFALNIVFMSFGFCFCFCCNGCGRGRAMQRILHVYDKRSHPPLVRPPPQKGATSRTTYESLTT